VYEYYAIEINNEVVCLFCHSYVEGTLYTFCLKGRDDEVVIHPSRYIKLTESQFTSYQEFDIPVVTEISSVVSIADGPLYVRSEFIRLRLP